MDRRAFLAAAAAAIGGFALDPERALWVPGARRYFDIQQPTTTVRLIADRGEWVMLTEFLTRDEFRRRYSVVERPVWTDDASGQVVVDRVFGAGALTLPPARLSGLQVTITGQPVKE